MANRKVTTLYPHPFSKEYWRTAASEFADVRMLVFAALMIAIRVAMKLLSIPLAPGLKINTAFLANAVGAMVYGPVMAGFCAVITDILGYLQNPEGVYFVPFILTEVAGSVIFALFLYRAKVTPLRVTLSRFCICFFVNVVIQTPIYMWYYALFMDGKTYVLTIPGIVKNLFMFPVESVVLTFVLAAIVPVTNRLGLTYTGADAKTALRFNKKQIITLVLLFVVGTGCVGSYLNYHYETTSLSASYSTETRVERNQTTQKMVLKSTKDFNDVETLTVVEAAYKKFLGKEVTYTVAVYAVKEGKATDAMWQYSKSKAAKDEALERLGTATIVVEEKTDNVVSFNIQYVK